MPSKSLLHGFSGLITHCFRYYLQVQLKEFNFVQRLTIYKHYLAAVVAEATAAAAVAVVVVEVVVTAAAEAVAAAVVEVAKSGRILQAEVLLLNLALTVLFKQRGRQNPPWHDTGSSWYGLFAAKPALIVWICRENKAILETVEREQTDHKQWYHFRSFGMTNGYWQWLLDLSPLVINLFVPDSAAN